MFVFNQGYSMSSWIIIDSFSGLLNNAALMLILCVIYDTFDFYKIQQKTLRHVCIGVLVGLTSVIVMLNPWVLRPGLFFDSRWVLISLCGLFFGFSPTLIAVLIAGSFRLYQGGPGGVVGTVVIVVTAGVGLAWRYWIDRQNKQLGMGQLYVFGILVELAMLACMFIFPAEIRIPVVKAVAPPALLLYPFLTVIIGLILKRQKERRLTEKMLAQQLVESKRIESALLANESQLSNALEIAKLGHWEYNVLSDTFTFNDYLYNVFHTTADQVGGYSMSLAQYVERFIHPEDRELFQKEIQAAIGTTDYHYTRQLEHRAVYPNGEIGFVTVRFFIVKNNQGQTINTYGVNQNITERKQSEAEKEKLEIRLLQAQKMEAIGTLAGGIAHDFNNILAAILGYTELAYDDAPPGTAFQKDLEQVLIAATRAKDLVKQILAFSRQDQIERTTVQLQPLIKEGLRMLRSSIPTTISITSDIDPKCGAVLAAPTQIHQILMNLCTNAYHAMEKSGGELSVTLETKFIKPDDHEMLLHLDIGEYLELSVADSGTGISPEIIDKIFDPYFTTKEVGKGTGMGLAIIHGIMKDCDGMITVESHPGNGSNFHLYFPVVENGALPEIKKNQDICGGKERILFIDDEVLLAEMGKDMLERLGYHVTLRHSSIDALHTFQNCPNEFDMVITDQTMPEMTGSELAKRMLQIRPDISIVLCTGYSNLIDKNSAKALGIKDFALKPLTKGMIAKLIRKVLDA